MWQIIGSFTLCNEPYRKVYKHAKWHKLNFTWILKKKTKIISQQLCLSYVTLTTSHHKCKWTAVTSIFQFYPHFICYLHFHVNIYQLVWRFFVFFHYFWAYFLIFSLITTHVLPFKTKKLKVWYSSLSPIWALLHLICWVCCGF